MGLFSNVRSADLFGDIHFVTLYAAILSRLAYFNDNLFLEYYTQIVGPVIVPQLLSGIDSISPNKMTQKENYLDIQDHNLFKLENLKGEKNNSFTLANALTMGKMFLNINFHKLNIPQNVNKITKEITGKTPIDREIKYFLKGSPPKQEDVKYISIGWSNYGEVFVVADKRMPTTMFLIFRGTYSVKTASLYSKPTSAAPLNVGCGKDEKFLYGIFKTNVELIHTTMEAMSYLATDFLKATTPNSIKVFTTGHSLGGALCTNFAYLWVGMKKIAPYNSAPYNIFSDKIICVSLGAPRGMGSAAADKFTKFIKDGNIIYYRVTTRGDPVTAMPNKPMGLMLSKNTGYQHPGSNEEDMRKIVMQDCNSLLVMRPLPNVRYDQNLDCQNYKTRDYIPNPFSHTIYLNILYTRALDPKKFLNSEVWQTPKKETMCRVIIGTIGIIKAGFFDVSKSRGGGQVDNTQKTMRDKFGGVVQEDVNMNAESFRELVKKINNTNPLVDQLCPMGSRPDNMFDPFIPGSKPLPRLSCVNASLAVGGGKNSKIGKTMKHSKNTRKNRGSRLRRKTRNSRGGNEISRAEKIKQQYTAYRTKCFTQTNTSMIKNAFKSKKNKSDIYKPIQSNECRNMLNDLNTAYKEEPKRVIQYHDDSSSSY